MNITHTQSNFSPLVFLSSLGAGGLSVGAFIIIQYGIFTGSGLSAFSDIAQTPLVIGLESIMLLMALVHLVLTVWWLRVYLPWLGSEPYKAVQADPLVNSTLMAPFISFLMSMNVIVATVRYFVPPLQASFQEIMPIAFGFLVLLFVLVMYQAIKLLSIALRTKFDASNIHFGWLLSAFATAMAAVTASGFAALSQTTWVAHAGAFMAVLALTLTIFLFVIKSIVIYTQHVQRTRVLDYQFMPTYLIGIPILTLVGIALFRLGHYADHQLAMPVIFNLSQVAVVVLLAIQLWMLVLGLVMMRGYWSNFLSKQYHVSQWGLVCPFVALVALGSFANMIFFHSDILLYALVSLLITTTVLFGYLLKGQIQKKYITNI